MQCKLRETTPDVLICDGAKVSGDVTLGKGVNIWYNAVLHSDVFPTTLGECVTVGHGAIVHGCTVGNNVLIGMGAIVLNGANIGDDCIVGAGALVTGKMDAPAGSMILGSPAKVARPLTEAEIASNRESAEGYLHAAEAYRRG